MHDLLIVGIPLLVILAGILFSRHDVKSLRDELREDLRAVRSEAAARHGEMLTRHGEILTRLANIDADLRQFYHLSGKLEGRIEAIEKRF